MNTPDLFDDPVPEPEIVEFKPTRAAGLARLEKFISRTGAHYASQRNFDFGSSHRSSVSVLSPWIRHRLVTEQEVLTHTLARHSRSAATKFIQEVFWRAYFKGWLEQHPSVWRAYECGVASAHAATDHDQKLKEDYTAAIQGRTGIACFDHWSQELIQTGYLHNHARMWFASIWIFTLRLPWELGADFFLRTLMDGDPASNTLSWRWVGGLHTKGKTYLARPDNIARFTNGRFHPAGQLSRTAEPLVEDADHPLVSMPAPHPAPNGDALFLITSEDCSPEDLISDSVVGVLGVCPDPPLGQNQHAHQFTQGAVHDAVARFGGRATSVAENSNWADAIIEVAQKAGTDQVITAWAPLGLVATRLNDAIPELEKAGIRLHRCMRLYDRVTWPHATKGFFKLRKKIPDILSDLKLG